MSRRDNPRCILLVEGKEDYYIIDHLSDRVPIPASAFSILEKDGYQQLLDDLDVYVDGSVIDRLGIVVDANSSIVNRWASLYYRLTRLGYKGIPTSPQANGLIVYETDKPITGIWIMPDNIAPGMLEDFVARLIPSGDALWPYAQQCVEQIPEIRFKSSYRSKAYIHTWLAWQEEPGTTMGWAIAKRYLDITSSTAVEFVTWLKELFDLS